MEEGERYRRQKTEEWLQEFEEGGGGYLYDLYREPGNRNRLTPEYHGRDNPFRDFLLDNHQPNMDGFVPPADIDPKFEAKISEGNGASSTWGAAVMKAGNKAKDKAWALYKNKINNFIYLGHNFHEELTCYCVDADTGATRGIPFDDPNKE